MARITPKTNWVASDIPVATDFNRIENNSEQAFSELDAEVINRNAAIASNTSPSEILNRIKTVDGSGSGLDSDFLQSYSPNFIGTNDIPLRGTQGEIAKADDCYFNLVASENLLTSDSSILSGNNTTMQKRKQYKTNFSGILRIKMTLSGGGSVTTFGQIYKNGVPFGTLRSSTTTSQVFSEDLSFAIGDTIELWARGSTSAVNYAISTFSISGSTNTDYKWTIT